MHVGLQRGSGTALQFGFGQDALGVYLIEEPTVVALADVRHGIAWIFAGPSRERSDPGALGSLLGGETGRHAAPPGAAVASRERTFGRCTPAQPFG
jgi:hypothetical protein